MNPADQYDLNRFVHAQDGVYETALAEVEDGQKSTHWMWFIFPQIDGLGFSANARRYAIGSLDEARSYLQHPILGRRLLRCAEAALAVQGMSAAEIFGSPDDMKLRSCATLFARASPPGSVFERLIAKYFAGHPDARTLELLERSG